MGFIEDELEEVKKLCEHLVQGCRLVTCVKSMVRIEIKKTANKCIVVCLQFPEDYPCSCVLLELKSKTLSDKLLNKLTEACEQDLKKQLGKPQILKAAQYINNFISENPLCVCYDEIAEIKKQICARDEIKLKQKTSTIYLKIVEGNYFIKVKLLIPDAYPSQSVGIEASSNFPPNMERFLVGQAKESARKCVEPPLRLPPGKTFCPLPSLLPCAHFFISAVRVLPQQHCQLCKKTGLPTDPEDAQTSESAGDHVERLYCNHLFHLDCLITYMKTPPFEGGKKCPDCGERIYHDKWRISDKMAEARWAHQEARKRELEDVAQAFL